MRSQDYPVEHFRFMAELAKGLAEAPAQILEHNYIYESFGSWWFICRYFGIDFRVVFDGKDTVLSIQKATELDWKDLISSSRKMSEIELLPFMLEVLAVARKERS